ncbi:hypothetical protein DF032_03235 [Burkholderia seminalis]|nr:hypothetical protein DF032_03235 [Burkholderia seminalis]
MIRKVIRIGRSFYPTAGFEAGRSARFRCRRGKQPSLRHARSAFSPRQLPADAAVILVAIAEIAAT